MTKLTTIAALTMLAGAANADFFFIGSEGEFNGNGDPVVATFATVVGTEFGPYGFTDVEGEFTAELGDTDMPGAFDGTFDLIGPGGVLTIEASGTTDNGGGADFFSYAGLWEVTGATGDYDGLTGSGDFSGSNFFENDDGGFMSLQIQGVLVPAPAGAVLLGFGGILAFRRRR